MILLLTTLQDTVQNLADTAQAVTTTAIKPQEDLHFIDLLFKGGWVMIPLSLLAF